MKKRIFWSILLLSGALNVQAQKAEAHLDKGNKHNKNAQFDLAEMEYKNVLVKMPENATARYNLSLALYRQKRYKEAKDVLEKLNKEINDPALKATAYYNKGVIHTKEKSLEESIESYKAALRLKPDDQQARENLQKALGELKKQQQEQQKQQKSPKPQSSLSQREAEQKLRQLQDKEKQIQERLQKAGQKGNSMPKDW